MTAARGRIEDPRLAGRPNRLGFLYKIRQIGPLLFACGSGGQNYISANGKDWRAMDEFIFNALHRGLSWMDEYNNNLDWFDDPEKMRIYDEKREQQASRIFWSLGGPDTERVYLAGETTRGILYLWDGPRAHSIELPTRKTLRDIHVGPDGAIWICGREGLLLKGYDRSFEVVADLGKEPRFASLAWFGDRLYLAASSGPQGLFVLGRDGISPVRTGLSPEPTDINSLEAVDGVLWVAGMKCLARFDGSVWEAFTVPAVND